MQGRSRLSFVRIEFAQQERSMGASPTASQAVLNQPLSLRISGGQRIFVSAAPAFRD
jgi:hypothetical protein